MTHKCMFFSSFLYIIYLFFQLVYVTSKMFALDVPQNLITLINYIYSKRVVLFSSTSFCTAITDYIHRVCVKGELWANSYIYIYTLEKKIYIPKPSRDKRFDPNWPVRWTKLPDAVNKQIAGIPGNSVDFIRFWA